MLTSGDGTMLAPAALLAKLATPKSSDTFAERYDKSAAKNAELDRLRRKEWHRQICNEAPDLESQKAFTDNSDQAYINVQKFIATKQTYLHQVRATDLHLAIA